MAESLSGSVVLAWGFYSWTVCKLGVVHYHNMSSSCMWLLQ